MGVRVQITEAEVVDLGNASGHGFGHKTISIEGNFVGTLQFQASTRGVAAKVPILAMPTDSETPTTDLVFATDGDQNGKYVVSVPANVSIHVEATVYTSGTATITTEDGVG